MFNEISAREINGNLIEMIGKETMLIAAGNSDGYNMMTASWGFAGEMWGKDSIAVVVRPQRYTMEFIDKSEYFSISFYGDNKEVYRICGSKSGRDCDKAQLCGLTPVFDNSSVYFEQARLVIFCKKQYVQQLKPECFTDSEPDASWYPQKDYHNLIIGKIEKVLIKD